MLMRQNRKDKKIKLKIIKEKKEEKKIRFVMKII